MDSHIKEYIFIGSIKRNNQIFSSSLRIFITVITVTEHKSLGKQAAVKSWMNQTPEPD